MSVYPQIVFFILSGTSIQYNTKINSVPHQRLYRGSGSDWPSWFRVSTSNPIGLLIAHKSRMSLPISCVIMKSCTNSSASCWPWWHTTHNCKKYVVK